MTDCWTREENQNQVSHARPQPLEIAKTAIPTFPPPRRLFLFFLFRFQLQCSGQRLL
jgi:hypothetical protein